MIENKIRTIGYAILFLVNVLLYVFLHSHFHFTVLIIMGVAPFLSIGMNFLLTRKLSVQIISSADREVSARQNEEAFATIVINNPTPFVSLDVKVNLTVENTFFGTSGKQIISVPVYAFKGYKLMLPIVPTLPGIVKLSVDRLKVKDLLGFVFFKKKLDSSKEIIVLPEYIAETKYDGAEVEQGMLESEESTKKGHDFSDVVEIREYVPGDKLMSIHWKLSAKRDILMVKDRATMSDKQLVVLPELCNTDLKQLEMIIVTAYSVIRNMIEDKTTVRLMYWSASSFEYKDYRIDYMEDADNAFSMMFFEKTYANMDEAAGNMANVHPEIKAYLHITADGSGAVLNVRENG